MNSVGACNDKIVPPARGTQPAENFVILIYEDNGAVVLKHEKKIIFYRGFGKSGSVQIKL